MSNAELAQKILDNLKTRKGTDQEGMLSISDINMLKKIANS